MTYDIEINPVMKTVWFIAGFMFIGLSFGLNYGMSWGFTIMGIGYLILFSMQCALKEVNP